MNEILHEVIVDKFDNLSRWPSEKGPSCTFVLIPGLRKSLPTFLQAQKSMCTLEFFQYCYLWLGTPATVFLLSPMQKLCKQNRLFAAWTQHCGLSSPWMHMLTTHWHRSASNTACHEEPRWAWRLDPCGCCTAIYELHFHLRLRLQ